MIAPLRFDGILKALVDHGVEFILVGGVAAVLEGAPLSTLDVDVVFLRRDENLSTLLDALRALNARYSDPAGRHIVPDADKLATLRTHRLVTSFGALDVMETIGQGLSYADLLGDTQVMEVAGVKVRVLGLETIILSKEQANRDKDRATLHILRRTLQMKQEPPGQSG
jgi:predicted nucleotidyltransferase